MTRGTLRRVWLGLAGVSIAIGLATVGLTEWLRLDPCHLCIFQRLLMLVFGALALTTALLPQSGRLTAAFGFTALCAAGAGVASAAYQSWIQAQPPGSVTCIGSDPSLIEKFVEWLGQGVPSLFLATGFCEDESFRFIGLSLANWSLIAFLILSGLTLSLIVVSLRHLLRPGG